MNEGLSMDFRDFNLSNFLFFIYFKNLKFSIFDFKFFFLPLPQFQDGKKNVRRLESPDTATST